jgi:amidase
MHNLVFATAQELATSIRQRRVSATEILEAHLTHIARHNPAINAIVTLDEERARARAQEADAALVRGELWGALHGVPITIKDSIETAGLRTTSGFPPLADYIPPTDAPVVARLRAAGAIILGKTNLPTLAGDTQTDNPIFGRTNNPWNIERTPGGSTGGGAAALAAGLSPLEVGSDYGGSVRIPAHYCGVYALKLTDHRLPFTGHIHSPKLPGLPRGLRHMAVFGLLARSVQDLILGLQAITGPEPRQPEAPPMPLGLAPERPWRALRVAWTDNFGGAPVSGDTRAALARLADALQQYGGTVARCLPEGFDFPAVWETYGELRQCEVGSTMSPEVEEERAASFGVSATSEDPEMRGRARRLHATMRQYTATLTKRDGYIAAVEWFFETWDVLLCPVSVGPAFPHCTPGTPIAVDGRPVPYRLNGTAYTSPFNLTGHPVVVLPLARSTEGLPIGVQVVGPRWGEMAVLAIAERLALVIGPFQRPSGY